MSCEDYNCKIIDCENTSDLSYYTGLYSLQDGTVYSNDLIRIPDGFGGFYVVPQGTYSNTINNEQQFVTISDNLDCPQISIPGFANAGGSSGCQTYLTMQVPAGLPKTLLDRAYQSLAVQVARKKLKCCIGLASLVAEWHSGRVANGCIYPDYSGLMVVGPIPPYLSATKTEIVCAPGTFSSKKSQADADSKALRAVDDFIDSNSVVCGWWNTKQVYTCDNMATYTVNAETIFSTISQQDADDQALASARSNCPGSVNWNSLTWGGFAVQYTGNPDGGTFWGTGDPYYAPAAAAVTNYFYVSAIYSQGPASTAQGSVYAVSPATVMYGGTSVYGYLDYFLGGFVNANRFVFQATISIPALAYSETVDLKTITPYGFGTRRKWVFHIPDCSSGPYQINFDLVISCANQPLTSDQFDLGVLSNQNYFGNL